VFPGGAHHERLSLGRNLIHNGARRAKQSVSIDSFLADVEARSPVFLPILQRVRSVLAARCEACEEQVKYGGIVFVLAGELIGGVFPYKAHVSIEFSRGAEFDDPHRLLAGGGKHRRHLLVSTPEELSKVDLAGFVDQAVALR